MENVGRDLAMQVAAMNPIAAHRHNVPQDVQDKELEIGRDMARLAGKPERLLDRIAQVSSNAFSRIMYWSSKPS